MVINGKYTDVSGTKKTFNLIKALKHWRMMAVYASVWTNKISNHATPLKRWYGDKYCLDLGWMMKLFKHVTVCNHWMVTNHRVWFMGENEDAIESCSKTKTLAVYNKSKTLEILHQG